MVEEDSKDVTEKARSYYEQRKKTEEIQNKKKQNKRIFSRLIEEEMKKSYLDYAMSVIVGRALPDVKDGLKPVHRRILYAMWRMNMLHNKPYKKCATVVGNTLGKYHPHGDTAVYDALVRMAQDFSLRYPLIQGQGNFGCFTKNTKVKLTDGRELSFKELIKEHKQGKKNYTYSINSKGLIEIAEIKKPRLTKKKEKVMKVILDNGEEIKCTLDHRFMLKNGSYREAQKLKAGDSLMPVNLRLSTKKDNIKPELVDYQMIYQPKIGEWIGCHILADNWNIKNKVYAKNAGRIRHHIDFNKFNNNPDNVKRIKWKDHWKLHADHASELHKNPEYKKKIAEGRKKFWLDKKNREIHAKRLSERNKKNWQDPKYREHMRKILREINLEFSKKHPELKEEKSKRLKKLWQSNEYKEMMSKLKSKEMKKRWKNNDPSLRRFTSRESKEIWSRPDHKELISKKAKERWQNKQYREKMSEQSKLLWKDENYRAKFSQDHFSKMAQKLWEDQDIKKLHREKTIQQWQNPEFRKKIIESVKTRNKQRINEDPNFMKKLNDKAKIALQKKWKNPSYKKKVMKSKILKYVNTLTKKYPEVTPQIYENERNNNCYPKIKSALKYFDNFSDMVKQAKVYNHKVVRTEILKKREDVYDLTIEETHNFTLASGVFVHNSIDGDSAAAYRYTEARLSKIAEELLFDIDKETVKFLPNFDESLKEPNVLPSKIPNLLINGSSGIAVGMATNIPPHNLIEVCDGIITTINNPEIPIKELNQIIKGPDFPTAAIITGTQGILQSYSKGRGKITIKSKADIEKDKIIITEIPYMVNKANLVEEIANLVKNKTVIGIRDIRDESDRRGMRIVIELKKDANTDIILNQLYKHSRLQVTFGINIVALVNNEPKTLNLKELIHYFIEHRKDIITKRTQFDLKKAEKRKHILEGLIIALDNIDSIIRLIKKSKSAEIARNNLIESYKLSIEQAQAILDMRLQRLTSLEQEKIKTEHKNLLVLIDDLKSILASEQKILDIIKNELNEIKKKYGNERKTQIVETEEIIEVEDLIEQEDVVVTITHSGYVKRTSLNEYRQQKRGGKGVIAATTKDEDFIENVFVANTHSYILCFTEDGIVHWLKVYQIPEASRTSKGKAIVNLLNTKEKITAFIPIRTFKEGHLFMATKKGIVKKTSALLFSKPRKGGIRAIKLTNDRLINVKFTNGNREIILATKKGNAVRFHEKNIRSIGRTGQGVRGIKLKVNDELIGMVIAKENKTLLTITENGYGKRTKITDYRLISRGGSGVRNIICSERNGQVVSIKSVKDNDEVMLISKKGIIIRMPVSNITIIGRTTQGARLMKLKKDKVVAAAKIAGERLNDNSK